MTNLKFLSATAEPALLDLPWQLALEDWPEEKIAALPKGISRHTVRFVKLDDHVIAIKETLFDLAKREYEMLRDLEKLEIPCVEPFAIVSGRKTEDGEELPAVLITRHLKYSLPYRAMWSQGIKEQTAKRLVDALALLLVRLHLIGFSGGMFHYQTPYLDVTPGPSLHIWWMLKLGSYMNQDFPTANVKMIWKLQG
jgi:hypothetical protein